MGLLCSKARRQQKGKNASQSLPEIHQMELVLSNSPVLDFKPLKQGNSMWYSESGSIFKTGNEIVLQEEEVEYKTPDESSLEEFINDMSSLCSTLTILTIEIPALCPYLENNIPKTLCFPKLKCFTIMKNPEETFDIISKNMFEVVRTIVANSPKLDKFCISGFSSTPASNILKCLESANSIDSISKLEVTGFIDNQLFKQLLALNMTLQVVKLRCLWDSCVNSKFINNFLNTQCKTLEVLELKQEAEDPQPVWIMGVDFPRMEKLTKLDIYRCSKQTNRKISIKPIESFENTLPVLESLKLYSENKFADWEDFLKIGISGRSSSMRELYLDQYDDDFPDTLLKNCAVLFPNITKLAIPAEVEVVNLAFLLMPKLKELILNNGHHEENADFMTQIITGRKLEDCQEIRKLGNGNFAKMQEKLNQTKHSTNSISCLKYLQVLRLTNEEKDPVEISEAACLELIKLKRLKVLDFCGKPPPTWLVSEQMLLEMRKHFEVLY